MDNFIDKIAQKLGSQELIRANASAEAKEMKQMKEKLEEYETLVQQMRQVHLKNVELLGRMQATVDALERLEDDQIEEEVQVDGYTSEDLNEIKSKLEEIKATVSASSDEEFADLKARMDIIREFIDSSKTELAETIHSENVKVFRNVEAVVEEGFEKQEKLIYEENVSVKKKVRGIKPLAITTLVLVGLQFLGLATWAVDHFFNLGLF